MVERYDWISPTDGGPAEEVRNDEDGETVRRARLQAEKCISECQRLLVNAMHNLREALERLDKQEEEDQ